MEETETAALRSLSRAAFGQQYRLEVMLAVARADDGLVCLTDLAHELDLSVSNVQGALKSLRLVGLLGDLPPGDSRRKYLIRNESSAWAWAEDLARMARLESVSGPA